MRKLIFLSLFLIGCDENNDIRLSNSDWECINYEYYHYTTFISTGKFIYPIDNIGRRCSNYIRKSNKDNNEK